MRQRSNLIILFGIAFFLVGGAIVYLILGDDDSNSASANSSGVAQVSILVAGEDIAANTVGSDVVEQGMLTTKQVAAGSQPVGAITSASGLENQIFAVDVEKGAPVTSAQLATRSLSNITVPDGFDGVAVTVEYTNGGAGYVAPGDTVNVYGVFGNPVDFFDAGVGAEGAVIPRTELVLTNVMVLDVSAQQATSVQTVDAAGEPAVGRPAGGAPLTYFLALKPQDAERVVQLQAFAGIHIGLTADDAPAAGDTPGIDGTSSAGQVSAASAAPQS